MKRTAEARWNGGLLKGNGTMRLGSGAYEGKYSFGSRALAAVPIRLEATLG